MEKTVYPSNSTILTTALLVILLAASALLGFGCGGGSGNPLAVSPDVRGLDNQDLDNLERSIQEPDVSELRALEGRTSNRNDDEDEDENEAEDDTGDDSEVIVMTVSEFSEAAYKAYDEAYALYAEYNQFLYGTDEGMGVYNYIQYFDPFIVSDKDAKWIQKNVGKAVKILEKAMKNAPGVVFTSEDDLRQFRRPQKMIDRMYQKVMFEYVYHIKIHLPEAKGKKKTTNFLTFYDKSVPGYKDAKALYVESLELMETLKTADLSDAERAQIAGQIEANYAEAWDNCWKILKPVSELEGLAAHIHSWYYYIYARDYQFVNIRLMRNFTFSYIVEMKPQM